jgi:hypothetical protein
LLKEYSVTGIPCCSSSPRKCPPPPQAAETGIEARPVEHAREVRHLPFGAADAEGRNELEQSYPRRLRGGRNGFNRRLKAGTFNGDHEHLL